MTIDTSRVSTRASRSISPERSQSQVGRFRDMLVALRAAVEVAIKSGNSEEAAVREVKLPAYAAIARYADWLPHDVRAAYRYLRR